MRNDQENVRCRLGQRSPAGHTGVTQSPRAVPARTLRVMSAGAESPGHAVGSAPRDVLHLLLAGGDEGHHVAEFGTDLLDLVLLAGLLESQVVRTPVLVLGDPFGREPTVLDLVQDGSHLVLDRLVDDPGAAGP